MLYFFLLLSDIEKIQAAIGDKAAIFIGNMSTFISAFVVAFAVSWKMALVDSAVLPLLVILAAVTTKVQHWWPCCPGLLQRYSTGGLVAQAFTTIIFIGNLGIL